MKELNSFSQPVPSTEISSKVRDLSSKTFVGIDFGTSTTVACIAYYDPNTKSIKTKALALNQKMADGVIVSSEKIPTMLAWHNNQLLVGEGANGVRLKKIKDRNLWISFKMDLGKKNDFLYSNSELSTGKKKLRNGKEAATIFFKYLSQQINKYLSENHYPTDTHYSISIPASFEPNQRKDLLDALAFNKFSFKEQAFIDEPNAAFLSYISDPELQKHINLDEDYNRNILVFDYGAGTCDVSILEVSIDQDKFHSSNLAISKFDFIGGKEVDRLIANDILLSQFLSENNLDKNFFTTREVKRFIIPKLEKAAELLKIKVSKSINLVENKIDEVAPNEVFELNSPVYFKSRKGNFTLSTPSITFEQFQNIVSVFTTKSVSGTYNINTNERFFSIFKPIKTALDKSGLSKRDIDYVLFIGGSSKNPLIRNSVKKFFPESEYLIPKELQKHVAAGTAINSYLYNGFNQSMIKPITNDSIFLIVNSEGGENLYPIIREGVSLPTEKINIQGLIPPIGSSCVELPICLGDKENLIYNIVIDNEKPFTTNDILSLEIVIDANRTINAKANVNNKSHEVKIENSLLSTETDSEKVEKAEYRYSKHLSMNNGEESKYELFELYNVYNAEKQYTKAAEIAEELNNKYNSVSLNGLGLIYSKAGNEEKSVHYFNRAAEEDGSSVALFNLAMEFEYNDKSKFEFYLKKCLKVDPGFGLAQYKLLLHERNQQHDTTITDRKLSELFESWKERYQDDRFPYHYSWLVSCARKVGEKDFAKKVEKSNQHKDINRSKSYDSDNLADFKEEQY
ncbi:Chaperone protein DnaK [Pseudoalteromonas haloplanktis]|uniref:Chaperone protein DnaK n=1 Tax=Pseudoalteromonas haloplanktis TaxID=228 RepID=A0A9W4QYZ5_PSEHA|nr:Hsp70 family protein [Pseudoalteromonas haloplanktis]CAH9059603.1 Chaperone protein DnaK [Pseudoalteromonas haloplanktis]